MAIYKSPDDIAYLDVHPVCARSLAFLTVHYLRHGSPQRANPAMLAADHATLFGSR
jgi:hypothetical protein